MANFKNETQNELLAAIDTMPVADTHEHLTPEPERIKHDPDFIKVVMTHYAGSDLVSSGMTHEERWTLDGTDMQFEEKAGLFMKFWPKTSNTTYCRAIDIAVKDLYGVEKIDGTTLPEINKKMHAAVKPGMYKNILEERCNIKYCVWDGWSEYPDERKFFRPAYRLDNFVFINETGDIKNLEKSYGAEITSLSGLTDALEKAMTDSLSKGMAALKSGLAYSRTLDYAPVTSAEASLALEHILLGRFNKCDAKILQDHMMHRLADCAGRHGVTFQIHTGMLEGNGNQIGNADPALLSQLIMHNPNTRFDLFHGGYPYGGELSAVVKMFRNAYLNLAWLHIVSPSFTVRYLSEWLEAVPVNKILAFGGDYCFVEGTYGHMQIAKENLANALAVKVCDGVYPMETAKKYAYMMLYENAEELYLPQ
ncbi:MAG: amidohydrolase [Defluviitaleaceae bacterium]|nr:amidohydrolase [Defluviitaleaceae bacterium]